MNWVHNFIKKQIFNDTYIQIIKADTEYAHTKIKALEDYFGIDFFNGGKAKPHYRKRKVVSKPIGRPKKK